jgi:aspartate/methionine/tyrosine aminotransferase
MPLPLIVEISKVTGDRQQAPCPSVKDVQAVPFRINRAVAAVRAAPIAEAQAWIPTGSSQRRFINLCQAVPSYPPADSMMEAIAAAAMQPDTGFYTPVRGLPELRQALAEDMAADYRGGIAPDDVAITAGCNQAFCAVLSAVAGPGDNVLLPVPWYFNHQMWLDSQQIAIRPLPLSPDTGWPDPAAAEALVDENTRAIVLVTPNNPTGSVYSPQHIGRFYDLAKAKEVALVIDETYKDFRLVPSEPAHGLFGDPDWRETLVQLYSFSKAFAITGYRVGSVIGGAELLDAVEKIVDCMAICAPRIAQEAALYGLRHLTRWKRDKAGQMEARLKALTDAFATPGLEYRLVSAGAYFAYVRHPFAGEGRKRRPAARQRAPYAGAAGQHVRTGPGALSAACLRQCRCRADAGNGRAVPGKSGEGSRR